MKLKIVALLLFVAVFLSVAAEAAVAESKIYEGEIIVPKKLRTEGVPEKFSYIFHESKELQGVLKISTPDYYYWVFVSDWEKGVFGQTTVRSNEHSQWRKVVWQGGKPAGEIDAIIVEHIKFFMGLIKPHIVGQKKEEKDQ